MPDRTRSRTWRPSPSCPTPRRTRSMPSASTSAGPRRCSRRSTDAAPRRRARHEHRGRLRPDAAVPIDETPRSAPRSAYGRTKLAQEAVARRPPRAAGRSSIVRAFNHIGPGQRPAFVVPAFARRVLDLKAGESPSIPVGNLSARRDFTDVRDVVRAYRLLLELVTTDPPGSDAPIVVNVGAVARSRSKKSCKRCARSPASSRAGTSIRRACAGNEVADRVANTALPAIAHRLGAGHPARRRRCGTCWQVPSQTLTTDQKAGSTELLLIVDERQCI